MEKGIGQTELVRLLDLQGTSITRECLVKIERGIQHIRVDQLEAIKDLLNTTYDELLKQKPDHDRKREETTDD
ncbi:MAG: helix-turn-helix domain-containing protein [Lachnospiraceae bacterium]|nr:helix-turn-helix domain-containing protein [Lachnospiraceae bacterium]